MTREHIFPFWLSAAIGGKGGVTNYMTDGSEPDPPVGEAPDYRREWRTGDPDVVARCVCRACNNGWMNDLDVAVEPIVAPLAGGGAPPIGNEDRKVAATWIIKTAILLEHTRPPSDLTKRRALAPPTLQQELFERQAPPEAAHVWLGRVRPLQEGAWWRTAPVPLFWIDPEASVAYGAPNASLNTFVLGGGLFQTLFAPLTSWYVDLARERTRRGADFMRFLWPPNEPLEWPPQKALRLDKLDLVSRIVVRK